MSAVYIQAPLLSVVRSLNVMSEVLRSPWILQSVLDDLSNDPSSQSGLNHLHRTPKLAQIIQVSQVQLID